MVFEERLALLIRKAQEDYKQILLSSNFDEDDMDKTAKVAEKITIAKTMLAYMESSLQESYSDVEVLLFYDKPLTALYEDFKERGTPLWCGLLEPLNSFIISTRHHMKEVMEQWDAVPMDEVQKAGNYFQMEKLIEQYDSEREQGDDLEQ